MKKDNYKSEFEEHRQEIGQDDDNLPSRAELHRKGRKSKKKSSHTMINVVLGLFTLIPVIILVYVVSDFYNPGSNPSAKDGDTTISYEETKNKKTQENIEEPEKDIVLDEKDDDVVKVNEKDAEEGKQTPEVDKKTEEKPVVNVNPTPEKKPEAKPEVKPEVKPVKNPEKNPEKKPSSKTHIVANGETLYRISVNYYGSDVGVEKIKSANGLSSNEIMVGQTLTIP